jgi:hypothetical protein
VVGKNAYRYVMLKMDDTTAEVEAYTLRGPQDYVLALWLPGRAHDICDGVPVDVWVDLACEKVTGYEPLNGTTQALASEHRDGRTLLRGVLVRDYPLLLRVAC